MRSALSVRIIVIVNGIGDQGSNPRRGFLRFLSPQCPTKINESVCFPSYRRIIEQTGFFYHDLATSLGKRKL